MKSLVDKHYNPASFPPEPVIVPDSRVYLLLQINNKRKLSPEIYDILPKITCKNMKEYIKEFVYSPNIDIESLEKLKQFPEYVQFIEIRQALQKEGISSEDSADIIKRLSQSKNHISKPGVGLISDQSRRRFANDLYPKYIEWLKRGELDKAINAYNQIGKGNFDFMSLLYQKIFGEHNMAMKDLRDEHISECDYIMKDQILKNLVETRLAPVQDKSHEEKETFLYEHIDDFIEDCQNILDRNKKERDDLENEPDDFIL